MPNEVEMSVAMYRSVTVRSTVSTPHSLFSFALAGWDACVVHWLGKYKRRKQGMPAGVWGGMPQSVVLTEHPFAGRGCMGNLRESSDDWSM